MSKLITPQLTSLRKKAMLNKDESAKAALQSLSAAFKQLCVDERIDVLTEKQEMTILVKQLKQRKESAKIYADAGREDLELKENQEIAFLEEFLPKQLTDEEIALKVDEAIASFDKELTKQDMGEVMKKLSNLKGSADMAKVSGLVRSKL